VFPFGRLFTPHLSKSIGIGLIALVVSFAPFAWSIIGALLGSKDDLDSHQLMAISLDDWFLGTLAAGVAWL
jgi:hypothetical protein